MNKLFKFFLPLVAVCAVAVACDDKEDKTPASKEIAGLYEGTVSVIVPPATEGTPTPAKIQLTQVGDKVKMELKESQFNTMIKGGAVVINDVTVAKGGDKYTLAGTGKVTLIPTLDPTETALTVTVTGGGNPAALNLSIVVPYLGSTVKVDFAGARK